MPKLLVQFFETVDVGDGRKETKRSEDRGGWILPYDGNITIGQLWDLLEVAHDRHSPHLRPLRINYLKDAPSEGYEGGLLSVEDIASNIFNNSDTIRVFHTPSTGPAGLSTAPQPTTRYGSVAPGSCASRPPKRQRESNVGLGEKVRFSLPPVTKRRRLDLDHAVVSVERDVADITADPSAPTRSVQAGETVVVADSQNSSPSTALRTSSHRQVDRSSAQEPQVQTDVAVNAYSTPESHSANETASQTTITSFKSIMSSPVRRSIQEAPGERAQRRESTPKSESPEIDSNNNLVYSVPASANGTPTTPGRAGDRFLKPGLPASQTAKPRLEGESDSVTISASNSARCKTPELLDKDYRPASNEEAVRVSGAKALAGRPQQRRTETDIFDMPDDIDESSQTAIRRSAVPFKNRSRSVDSRHSSLSRRSSRDSDELDGSIDKQSSLYAETAQKADYLLTEASKLGGSSPRALEDGEATGVDVPEGPQLPSTTETNLRAPRKAALQATKLTRRMYTHAVSSPFVSHEPSGQAVDVDEALQSLQEDDTITLRREQQKAASNKRLADSISAEREDLGLDDETASTPKFDTAPIPSSGSARKSALRTPSVSRNTPLGFENDNSQPPAKRSVSFADETESRKSTDTPQSPAPSLSTPAKRKPSRLPRSSIWTPPADKPSSKQSAARSAYYDQLFKKASVQPSLATKNTMNPANPSRTSTPINKTIQPGLSQTSDSPSAKKFKVSQPVKAPDKPTGGRAATVVAKRSDVSETESDDESDDECSDESDAESSESDDASKASNLGLGSDASSKNSRSTRSDNQASRLASSKPNGDDVQGDAIVTANTIDRPSIVDENLQRDDSEDKFEAEQNANANHIRNGNGKNHSGSTDVQQDESDEEADISPEGLSLDEIMALSKQVSSGTEERDSVLRSNLDGSEISLIDENRSTRAISASESASVAELRSPAREIQASSEDDESGSEYETSSESEKGVSHGPVQIKSEKENISEHKNRFRDSESEDETSESDEEMLQHRKVNGAASITKTLVSQELGTDRESYSSKEASDSENEVDLPPLRNTFTRADRSMREDDNEAERQLQREATQSMEAHLSTPAENLPASTSTATPKPSSLQKTSRPSLAASQLPSSQHKFPSFSEMVKDPKLSNMNNPPYKISARKISVSASSDEDESDSDSTSDSDESDNEAPSVAVAKPATNKKPKNSALGLYKDLMKNVRDSKKR